MEWLKIKASRTYQASISNSLTVNSIENIRMSFIEELLATNVDFFEQQSLYSGLLPISRHSGTVLAQDRTLVSLM